MASSIGAGSPARSAAARDAAPDRTGFFHTEHSTAPKIPTQQRFRKADYFGMSLEQTPGPGQYDMGSSRSSRGVATIGRAQRYGSTPQAKKDVTGVGSPGPAAYDSAKSSFTMRGVGTIDRAPRRTLAQQCPTATDTAVGPGSYDASAARSATSARTAAALAGPSTIGRAPRLRQRAVEPMPGPGCYESRDPDVVRSRSNPAARGGTFGRSARTALFKPASESPGAPGVGQYGSVSSSFGKSKGGVMGRSARSIDFKRPTSGTPGPGSYTPHFSVQSKYVRGGYSGGS